MHKQILQVYKKENNRFWINTDLVFILNTVTKDKLTNFSCINQFFHH